MCYVTSPRRSVTVGKFSLTRAPTPEWVTSPVSWEKCYVTDLLPITWLLHHMIYISSQSGLPLSITVFDVRDRGPSWKAPVKQVDMQEMCRLFVNEDIITLYRRKRPYGFIIEKNNKMGSKTVPMGSKMCSWLSFPSILHPLGQLCRTHIVIFQWTNP